MAKAAKTKTVAGSDKSGGDETDFENMYGTSYLSAADVKKPTPTEIVEVGREVFDRPNGASEAKATLTLRAFRKPLVCNKTNALVLAEAFGKVMANWPGKPVLVKAEQTSFQGKPVRGVRVYPRDVGDMRGDAITY
jgi:hypothetical protein